MVKILERTPFGFVMELQNEYAYFAKEEYKLYLNDQLYGVFKQNVVAIFGLEPKQIYDIKIKSADEEIVLTVETRAITYLINIYDYNATGDGQCDDTGAINTAIYTAPKGAVVYIPAGTYLVNQIYLKSGVDIYLEEGSVIKQNTDRNNLSVIKGYQKDYHHTDARVNASWEGNPLDSYCGIFFGYDVEHVKIYGAGVIDGSGREGGWWENAKVKNVAFRPKNIFLNRCTDITISGIKSQNSACWNVHPLYCEDLYFYGLSLASDKDSVNTDGIDPESCKNVNIVGCRFTVGDDCVALKSGKYFMSQTDYQPCEKIIVRNCYMGDGHGGIAIGSEISSGVRELTVEKCYMDGTDRGVRVKTRRGRGDRSVLEQIRLVNIEMNHVRHCLAINMFYHCDPDGKSEYVQTRNALPKDEMTPQIQNIEISKMNAKDIRGCGIFMYGLPESKIANVTITGCHLSFCNERINEVPEMLEDFDVIPNLGIFIENADAINMEDNTFVGDYVSIIDEEGKNG